MERYETRFPTEGFFLTQIAIGDGTGVGDLLPLISSAEARRKQGEAVLAYCREKGLPLSVGAEVMGKSIEEVMYHICEETVDEPLLAEWSDEEGRSRSRSAATSNSVLMLTRGALFTAARLGLLERLAGGWRLLAPRSLRSELLERVDEAKFEHEHGKGSLGAGPGGLHLESIDELAPALASELDARRRLLEWIEQTVEILPRPLRLVGPVGSPREEARQQLGRSAHDAVALALEHGAVLFADDLGLRRYEIEGARADSVSTIILLEVMEQRGLLSSEELCAFTVRLIGWHYSVIHPSVALLSYVARRAGNLVPNLLDASFGTLSAVGVPVAHAVDVAARVIRTAALDPVATVEFRKVVRLALSGLARRYGARIAPLLRRACAEEMVLLPRQLDLVRQECNAFMRKE